ncbi:hypothetical protein [Oscillibacter sp. CU971]|jgi:hypothetical protein|uniref:hypothetical protein n=1 Tax=Oscillibacter sp. CU971 TaxID=2780102 RepID=UPI00195EAE6F|nr:hypothetical protein [Oscillibacter sp. CU971]
MDDKTIKETIEILKRLSPKNQAYFMTLVRLAEVAENGVKNELVSRAGMPPQKNA